LFFNLKTFKERVKGKQEREIGAIGKETDKKTRKANRKDNKDSCFRRRERREKKRIV
jgi:hypothetical protein